MSILTGEPRGRVTVVNNSYPTAPDVLVIPRDEVRELTIRNRSLSYRLSGDAKAHDYGHGIQEQDEALQIYTSIVSEDVDVVWTRSREGWTRVPDHEKVGD